MTNFTKVPLHFMLNWAACVKNCVALRIVTFIASANPFSTTTYRKTEKRCDNLIISRRRKKLMFPHTYVSSRKVLKIVHYASFRTFVMIMNTVFECCLSSTFPSPFLPLNYVTYTASISPSLTPLQSIIHFISHCEQKIIARKTFFSP